MSVYLNTYETWQAYGGPEEGGWWYECGTPVQSMLISNDDFDQWLDAADPGQIQSLRDNATAAYTQGKAPVPKATGYGGYVFLPGSDEPSAYMEENSYCSCFEEHFAEPFPQERPRYC